MIRTIFSLLCFVFVSISLLGTACDGSPTPTVTTDGIKGISTEGDTSLVLEEMPANLDSAKVSFRKLNSWKEGDLFCVTALVDNHAVTWQRIWVRIEFQDSVGNRVLLNGDSSLVVRAFADAIPPQGASSFFTAVPVGQFSSVPDTCIVTGAGALKQTPGAILTTNQTSGVRIQRPNPDDPTKIMETGYQASASIENPLELTAYRPWTVLLFYGKDTKLYYAQALSLEKRQEIVKMTNEGPMAPRELRQVTCAISYSGLPKKLQEQLIGFIDFQPFEIREKN